MELTGRARSFILPPLILAGVTATVVARTLDPRSIYDARFTTREMEKLQEARKPAALASSLDNGPLPQRCALTTERLSENHDPAVSGESDGPSTNFRGGPAKRVGGIDDFGCARRDTCNRCRRRRLFRKNRPIDGIPQRAGPHHAAASIFGRLLPAPFGRCWILAKP